MKSVSHAITLYVDDFDQRLPGPIWFGQKSRIAHGPANISEFVLPYLHQKPAVAEDGVTYLDEMTCPSNVETKLSPKIYERLQFLAIPIPRVGFPFRRPRSPFVAPIKINEITTPDCTRSFEEADHINYPYHGITRMPEFPVHFGMYRNTMFFDARVESVQ